MGGEKCRSVYDLNDENLYATEMNVLKLSGVQEDQIRSKNVLVDRYEGQDVNIRTVMLGDPSKPTMVLVHGYGGSGTLFYKTFATLCQHFYLIVIDVIGMGASSRPENIDKQFTPEQCRDYFCDYLEKWRLQMNITDFYLVGHSFGGYQVGLYACKYPFHIKKLVLASPIGVKPSQTEGQEPDMDVKFRGGRRPPKIILKIAQYGFAKKISPFSALRTLGKSFASRWCQGFAERRLKVVDPVTKKMVSDYLYQIFMRKGTSEYGLMIMFDVLFQPHLSLQEPSMMADPNFKVPFTVIFGDRDWVRAVDQGSSENLVRQKHQQGNYDCEYTVIPDSDHNLHMDNPVAFANAIVNFLLDENLPVEGQQISAFEDSGLDFKEERKMMDSGEVGGSRTMMISKSTPQVKLTFDEIDPKALDDEEVLQISARSNSSQ